MGKFKFLIRKSGHSVNDISEDFDFMLSPNIFFNDMGYYTRFYMYNKYGKRISNGNLFIIGLCQSPKEMSPLTQFEGTYKIIDELPSSYVTVMDENMYYKLCQILPVGEERQSFANSLRIMHYGDDWDVWDCDSFRKGCLRNFPGKKTPCQKLPKDILFNKLFRNSRDFYDFKYYSYWITLSDGNKLKLDFGSRRIVWIKDIVKENATNAMYDIAMSLYLHAMNKNMETPLVEPNSEINKIIFVSHKSFLDDGIIPKIPKELNREVANTYCYVGLQSRFDLGEYEDTEEDNLIIDRLSIRNIDMIANDLENSEISDKIDNWTQICNDYASLYSDDSLGKIFSQINLSVGDSTIKYLKNFGEGYFRGIAYKHKLFIHALGMIGRNIQPYSVILLDWPDMFFDTKQMSFLLGTLYDMCEKMDSCVIINTEK